MKSENPVTTYLRDYREPDFRITHTDLEVELEFHRTRVKATHRVARKNLHSGALRLDCEEVTVESVSIDGRDLDHGAYGTEDSQLVIADVPDNFELTVINTCEPEKNTALSGLYKSGDMLCTQCEAEGFRRITPAIDRPDNLATYSVTLTADRKRFPVLLSNGNLEDRGELADGKHYCRWQDPFPKPTYLFAIVAGRLESLEDSFTTECGREVRLRFYARGKDIEKCGHAMASLKNAMRWDEEVYGREYDLDLYNVVAVEDFNMGAMENKSLNVFNTKYVLADSRMATDTDFENVEGVIGHEYFHNWSGNRVTCRDWFQLSLKEGFTVFRDQEFSADMGSRGVKRIEDVNILRSHQFREDASPMAHPVRPDSYEEINNFYTVTVYNKGAEVVRMLHTLFGTDGFRRATDLYFREFDGMAVTTDDFVWAFETAGDCDLTQFKNWYSQAGTPRVAVRADYEAGTRRLTLKLSQSCPPTPESDAKEPFVIPVRTALFAGNGEKLAFNEGETETVLVLDQPEQTFEFDNVEVEPVPSLLRRFSAPVELEFELSDDRLEVLLEHDDDPFNRWEAGQNLFLKQLLDGIASVRSGNSARYSDRLAFITGTILESDSTDRAFLARLLTLPGVGYINEHIEPVDPEAVHSAREGLRRFLAEKLQDKFIECYDRCHAASTGQADAAEFAARAMRDICLAYLCSLDDALSREMCLSQLQKSRCMSDAATAISLIARSARPDREEILEGFYQQWQDEPLVVDKWLRAQAQAPVDTALDRVNVLTRHPGFDQTNPNKLFSLILGFTHGNPSRFHVADGSGYGFLLQWVEVLDPLNPQVAARLVSALNGWRKYRKDLGEQMAQTLTENSSIPGLSRDTGEIVKKNLK